MTGGQKEVDRLVEPGRYRHFKGKEYEVIGVGRHTETMEELVFYRALYGERGLWARPVHMFAEKVLVNDEYIPRFQKATVDKEG